VARPTGSWGEYLDDFLAAAQCGELTDESVERKLLRRAIERPMAIKPKLHAGWAFPEDHHEGQTDPVGFHPGTENDAAA
jgi:hypothetical protein